MYEVILIGVLYGHFSGRDCKFDAVMLVLVPHESYSIVQRRIFSFLGKIRPAPICGVFQNSRA